MSLVYEMAIQGVLMKTMLLSLNEMASRIGSNPLHVQGAGGNYSMKENGWLHVKASGTWMKDALSQNILVSLPLDQLLKSVLEDDISHIPIGSPDGTIKKPSIETLMHALMPQRYVLHTHSVDVLAVAIQRNSEYVLAEKLKGINWKYVPYVKPGASLSQMIDSVVNQKYIPDVLILGNHGIVVGGATLAETEDLIERCCSALKKPELINVTAEPDMQKLHKLAAEYGLSLPVNADVHKLAFMPERANIVSAGSLYPDHVVFLGRGTSLIAENEIAKSSIESKIRIVQHVGVLLDAGVSESAHEMALALYHVACRLDVAKKIRYLTHAEEDELLCWDAEKYRMKLENSRCR